MTCRHAHVPHEVPGSRGLPLAACLTHSCTHSSVGPEEEEEDTSWLAGAGCYRGKEPHPAGARCLADFTRCIHAEAYTQKKGQTCPDVAPCGLVVLGHSGPQRCSRSTLLSPDVSSLFLLCRSSPRPPSPLLLYQHDGHRSLQTVNSQTRHMQGEDKN